MSIRKLSSLTREELDRLYHKEKLSQQQIAEHFGVTQGAILYWFRKYNLPARSTNDGLILLGKSGRFSGPKNPRWNGGRHIGSGGYVFVRMPEHQRASKRGYVREHVLVWEKAYGYLPPKGWHIHHKNGVKTDNRIENLEAMSNSDHKDVIPSLLRRIANLETELERVKHELDQHRAQPSVELHG